MPKFNSFVYDLFAVFKPEMIDGLCYVKFGLPPMYKNTFAPFGFDWVRTGESYDNVGHDLPYKENMGRYFIDSEKTEPSVCGGEDKFFGIVPDMYAHLCRSYTPGNLKYFPSENGKIKSYHVPVLSVYPYSPAHPDIPYLSLEIVIKREIVQILFDYDDTLFKVEGIDELPTEIGKYEACISVKCIKELEQDEYIRVVSVSRRGKVRNAGMLRICKNAEKFRYKINILLVNIKFLPLANDTSMVLSADTEAAAENIEYVFRHALIKTIIEEMDLDLGCDAEFTDRFRLLNGEPYLLTSITKMDRNGRKYADLDSMPELSVLLTDKLKAIQFDMSKYDTIIFCLGTGLASMNDKNVPHRTNGYSTDKYVMLSRNYTGITAVHEVLHTLELNHTFDNFHRDSTVSKYTYKMYSTDNIMDYSHLKYIERVNLWEWQWVKIREGCHPENS